MKRWILLGILAALMPCAAIGKRTIYLNMNEQFWCLDAAVPFAYVWVAGNDFTWSESMTHVENCIYSAEIDDEYTSIMFVRMPAGSTQLKWDEKWNVTNSMLIPEDKNMYTITGWGENDGYWSVYDKDPGGGGEGGGSLLDSGKCGSNLTWEFYSSGVLSITGTGEMNDYDLLEETRRAPWYSYAATITYLQLSASLTYIGEAAFHDCENLTFVTIPNSVTEIGTFAFKDCKGLGEVKLGNGLTTIGSYAFADCKALTDITLPDGLLNIYNDAFQHCYSLKTITIPQSVTYIDQGIFFSCKGLTTIEVENNNKNYCSVNGVLYTKDKTILMAYPIGKSDVSFIVPNTVTEIDDYAFLESNLRTVTLSANLTTIGGMSFYSCKSLTSIYIPQNVSMIGSYAFAYCAGLTSITCQAPTPPELSTLPVFNDVNKSIPLYVPSQSISAYKKADQWKDFTNIQAISGKDDDDNPGEKTEYTITTVVSDSRLGTVQGSGTYEKGVKVTLSAYAKSGARFARWSDGVTSASRTITVSGDATYTAIFLATASNNSDKATTGYNQYAEKSGVVEPSKGKGLSPKDVEQSETEETTTLEPARKIFQDGHIYILRDGKVYTLTGQQL